MECSLLQEEKLDVLYGEADAATRARVEAHLSTCPACREEMAALRGLRRNLALWPVPEEVISSARPRPPKLLLLAAAAALVLALGAAFGLSGSEVRYERGEFAVRLGGGNVQRLLAEQETRHRGEMQALEATLARTGPAPDEKALLAQVEDMIQRSEARQGLLLKANLAEWSAKREVERRYDMARISAGLSYLDGKNGQNVARTSELMGYVLEAAQKR